VQNFDGVKLSLLTHGFKLSPVLNCPFIPIVSNCLQSQIARGVKWSAVSNCPVSNCPRCQICPQCQIVLLSNCPRISLKILFFFSFPQPWKKTAENLIWFAWTINNWIAQKNWPSNGQTMLDKPFLKKSVIWESC